MGQTDARGINTSMIYDSLGRTASNVSASLGLLTALPAMAMSSGFWVDTILVHQVLGAPTEHMNDPD